MRRDPRQFTRPLAVALLMACASAPVAKGQTPASPHFFGRVAALYIGINDYRSEKIRPLTEAEADAGRIAGTLAKNYAFPGEEACLLGRNATKAAIEQKLVQLESELTENDAMIVFFAGHGSVVESRRIENGLPIPSRAGYWIPYDADIDPATSVRIETWDRECINMRKLVDRLAGAKAGHILIVADCCCSGFMTKRGGSDMSTAVNLLKNRSRTVVAATTQKEAATDGRFTQMLCGLLVRVAGDAEAASVTDVFQELCPKVITASNRKMTPQMGHFGEDDGEFVFFPSTISPVSIAKLKDEIREASAGNAFDAAKDSLKPVRGLLQRAQKRAGRRTTLKTLLAVTGSPNYWYGENAAEQVAYWKDLREEFRENASWGDPLAMVALHFCATRGIGEDQESSNPDQAYRWALAAMEIETTNGAGEYLLGHCYRHGLGVAKNEVAARRLYERSAKAGFVLGKFALASRILEEKPNLAEAARARALLQEAGDAGVNEALTLLATAYVNGDVPGIDIDIPQAIKLYSLAAERGSPVGIATLYEVYTRGQPGFPEKDLKRAEESLRRAAGMGYAPAQFRLGTELCQATDMKSVLQLPKSPEEAKPWFELAAEQKFAPSLLVLAQLYVKGNQPGFVTDHEKAREFLEQAVAIPYGPAHAIQGLWHIEPTGVYPRDERIALQCFKRAADLKSPLGCAMLGEAYEKGTGLDLPAESRKPFRYHRYSHYALHWHMMAVNYGGNDYSGKQLKGFRGDLNIVKLGLPYDVVRDLWPNDVLEAWKRQFPETATQFAEKYPEPKGR